jgi:hypothetical protein
MQLEVRILILNLGVMRTDMFVLVLNRQEIGIPWVGRSVKGLLVRKVLQKLLKMKSVKRSIKNKNLKEVTQ